MLPSSVALIMDSFAFCVSSEYDIEVTSARESSDETVSVATSSEYCVGLHIG